jgi:hypothetical protein
MVCGSKCFSLCEFGVGIWKKARHIIPYVPRYALRATRDEREREIFLLNYMNFRTDFSPQQDLGGILPRSSLVAKRIAGHKGEYKLGHTTESKLRPPENGQKETPIQTERHR